MNITKNQTHSISYTPPTYPSNPPTLIDQFIASTTPPPTKEQAYMDYLLAGLKPFRMSHADLGQAMRQGQPKL